jgi:hypothetical protein
MSEGNQNSVATAEFLTTVPDIKCEKLRKYKIDSDVRWRFGVWRMDGRKLIITGDFVLK